MVRYIKGDIVTYSSGVVKFINKPDRYERYFDDDYINPTLDLKIMTIQRFVKVLWFYKLKTIYRRKKGD